MQPSYVSRPTIFLPEHKISTDEIISDIEAHHPNHPGCAPYGASSRTRA